MNGEKISRCLDALPDEMVSEAMKPYRPRSLGWHIVRIAACLAIVIGLTIALWPEEETPGAQLGTPTEGTTEITAPSATMQKTFFAAPGILKVYAYDMNGVDLSKMTTYELTEGVVSHPYEWTFAMNSIYGLPLTLRVEDELWKNQPLTFYVETEYGGYYGDIHNAKYKKNENDSVVSLKDVNLGNAFEVENGETIFWTAKEIYAQSAEKGISPFEFLENIGNVIYTRIIIRCENHIVGYAMVKITHNEGWYTASVVRSVFYPLVDGQFQQITEEYVRQEMQNSNML